MGNEMDERSHVVAYLRQRSDEVGCSRMSLALDRAAEAIVKGEHVAGVKRPEQAASQEIRPVEHHPKCEHGFIVSVGDRFIERGTCHAECPVLAWSRSQQTQEAVSGMRRCATPTCDLSVPPPYRYCINCGGPNSPDQVNRTTPAIPGTLGESAERWLGGAAFEARHEKRVASLASLLGDAFAQGRDAQRAAQRETLTPEKVVCCDCGEQELVEAVFCRRCHMENMSAREFNTRKKTLEECITLSLEVESADATEKEIASRIRALLNKKNENAPDTTIAEREPSKLPPQETTRDMWLLTPLGSLGRSTIQVEQYEELRDLAIRLVHKLVLTRAKDKTRYIGLHTQECFEYAAKNAKAYCIVQCADARSERIQVQK